MSGLEQPEISTNDMELEEEEDRIKELMLTTPDSVDIVMHHPECTTQTGFKLCDCTPVTLRRGAKA